MKINGLLPWFGAKRSIAKRIVDAIGPHRCYFEPFCGSMAVLLSKPVVTMETVNDLHGDLINLARVLQDRRQWPGFYRRLKRTLFSAQLWRESADVIRNTPFAPGAERAYHYFVMCWFGRNGSAGSNGGVNFCVRYTSGGGSPGTRIASAVDSIPSWVERLRRVVILNMDAFELVAKIEDKLGTVIYLDPPYIVKGAKYQHDLKLPDHGRLADMLQRFEKTRVVVSYYEHPDIDDLYPPAHWKKLAITTTKAMVSSGRRDQAGRTDAPEILLVNDKPCRDHGHGSRRDALRT